MLVRSSISFVLPVLLANLSACSESPAELCERGAVVPVACVSGHTPTVLATSEQPPTTSNKTPKSPSSLHLALDEADVYFTTLDGAVMRVPKSGGTPESFASAPTSADPERTCLVSALTISSEFVYWSVNCEQLEECEAGAALECATSSFVNRAPKASGGAPEVVFEQVVGRIDAVVADGSELYVSAASGGTTALLEVTRGTKLHALGTSFAATIAVGPTVVYWGGRTARTASEIFAVPKEGVGTSSLAPSVRTTGVIETFVVDDDDVYWLERSAKAGLESREMKRRPKASEDGEATAIVSGELTPTTIAADATGLYGIGGTSRPDEVARFTRGEWRRERVALLGIINEVADSKVDATALYWLDYRQECSRRAEQSCDNANCASACTEWRMVSRIGKLPK